MNLVPCSGCSRHVRASEASCPFCATPIATPTPARAEVEGGRPASRQGVMFGVTVGAIAVSTALVGSACAAYGGPVDRPDAATAADATSGGADDAAR